MAKSILICDDAAFMRMMIKDILTKMVCNCRRSRKWSKSG